jgi:autoinducer 2-degrading protein
MHIIRVQIRVKPDCIEAFQVATLANARASIQEAGVVRFDVVQQQDDPTRFVLVEVYRAVEDQARHRLTAHYAAWVGMVGDMMETPRSALKYTNVFPEEEGW